MADEFQLLCWGQFLTIQWIEVQDDWVKYSAVWGSKIVPIFNEFFLECQCSQPFLMLWMLLVCFYEVSAFAA